MGDTEEELELEDQIADFVAPDGREGVDDQVQNAANESMATPMTQISMKSSQHDDGKYRLPKFLRKTSDIQVKKNDMYSMPELDFTQTDLRKRKRGVVDQLSIFAPLPHEKDKVAPAASELKMDRPVTPIDKEIKTQPLDWDQMAKYVRRRLASNDKMAHMSLQEQQDLAAILVGEVYHIWPDIKRQIDDPFLTPEQNKELNRRIAVHIVTVCEELYKHYLKKAQILNKRGIFSGPANMSRLKAQLGQESGKFLNVLIIRRYIVADMRGKLPELESVDDEYQRHFARKAAVPPPPIPRLSFKGMLKLSRPRAVDKGIHYKTAEEHLDELQQAMPDLETTKLMSVISQMPMDMVHPERLTADTPDEKGQRKKRGPVGDEDHDSSPEDVPRQFPGMQRSNSLPELSHSENLLQELDIEADVPNGPKKTVTAVRRSLQLERGPLAKVKKQEADNDRMMSEFIAADLRRLTAVQREPVYQGSADDDDMPPLLQAILRNAKHDKKHAEYNAMIAELELKEQALAAEQSKPLQKSEHPQPTTVSQLLPSNVVVRTSDIRVSERMCSEVITLRQNSTVYNELLDEIDSQTIKRLDSNLFLNQEIKEVYSEIMKTVPRDHLELELDELVEAAPLKLDTQGLLASATLTKKKANDRMINQHLVKSSRAPWGSHSRTDWEKTPHNPPRDSKGVPYFDPLAPSTANIAFANNPLTAFGGISLADLPQMVAERMTRSYAAWLTWWKGTIDGDDYKKYIALQETDFLGTVFHMYNDDAEPDNGASAETVPPKMELLAKELEDRRAERLVQMRNQKKQYTPGEWNVQAVMLGGLGKDPELQDDEATTKIKTAMRQEVQEVQNKKKLLGDIIKERANAGRHPSMGSSTAELSVPPTRVSFRTAASQSKGESQSGTRADASSSSASYKTQSAQARLEKVWTALHMTDALKLDMAIKYSAEGYAEVLEQAIAAWEQAARHIVERENVMAELEAFERLASDPNRFFELGYRGSSAARLDEARIRSRLYKRLEDMSSTIVQAVEQVKQQFNDIITYRGRPYLDKMRSDRVEMLYWLQEERKQLAIEEHRRFGSTATILDQRQQRQIASTTAILPSLSPA